MLANAVALCSIAVVLPEVDLFKAERPPRGQIAACLLTGSRQSEHDSLQLSRGIRFGLTAMVNPLCWWRLATRAAPS